MKNDPTKTKDRCIEYEGYTYWYEYRLAKHRIDICLATKNPQKYCNGWFLYSEKDPGNGKAFVIVATNNPNLKLNTMKTKQSKKATFQQSYQH